jgi:hypothetical protein
MGIRVVNVWAPRLKEAKTSSRVDDEREVVYIGVS